MYYNITLHLWFRQGLGIHVDLSQHFHSTVGAIIAAERSQDPAVDAALIPTTPWRGDQCRTERVIHKLNRVPALQDRFLAIGAMLRKIDPGFNMFDDLDPSQTSSINFIRST